jgi:hypothetical protein
MVVPEQRDLATAPPQRETADTAQAPVAAPPTPAAAPQRENAIEQPARQSAPRDSKATAGAREDRQREMPTQAAKEEVAVLQERAARADAAVPAPAAAPPPASPTLRAPAELGAFQKSARSIPPPAGIEVTNQSAPSDSVCWFVGRAGLVLLTTDAGTTFTRVDLPEPLDVVSVSATDGRNATVTTADGRRFRTEDGGRLWRPF